jgi:hypothetical protein
MEGALYKDLSVLLMSIDKKPFWNSIGMHIVYQLVAVFGSLFVSYGTTQATGNRLVGMIIGWLSFAIVQLLLYVVPKYIRRK